LLKVVTMEMKRVLTVAGSDSSGGAGIQTDLKTISALGAYGMSVITALTAQNTLGVQGIHEVPADFVAAQFDSVVDDIGVDAVKTGMLANSEIIKTVADKLKEYGIVKVVVDPVLVAKSGAPLLAPESRETLVRELLPLALVLTPNIPEAEELSGIAISSEVQMREAARKIYALGVRHVLVKGGHLMGQATDVLFDGRDFHVFSSERIRTSDTHGTGCTYASAIATGLAQGLSVYDAVYNAKKFLTLAIRHALRLGGGQGPTNPMAHLLRESERWRCFTALREAVARLVKEDCGNIIPEVQSNLGYALPRASGKDDVAAFPGRIIRFGSGARPVEAPAFGASSHISKIILTAMKYDETYRSAMNIRFSEEAVDACRELGFHVESFDRSCEPPETKLREGSSLEWGTDKVLARGAGMPDIIFDSGDVGKEPMIRVLGRSPDDVVEKVIRISKKLKER
jgi:hydroxymethylpyrimidine/phosphomethylpyrimidine kinase